MINEFQEYKKKLKNFSLNKKKSKKIKSEKIITMKNLKTKEKKSSSKQTLNSKAKKSFSKLNDQDLINMNMKKRNSHLKKNKIIYFNKTMNSSKTLNIKNMTNLFKTNFLERQTSFDNKSSIIPYTFSHKLGKGSYAIVYLGN